MTFTEGPGIWSHNPLLGSRSMPSGNVSKIIKAFIVFSFQHHKAAWIYTLHVNILHNLCVAEGDKEGRPEIPNRTDLHRFHVFPASCNTQTDFVKSAQKMNTQDIALWYFAVKLLLWMRGKKILNSFESKSHNISGNENPVEVTKGRGLKGIWKLYISKC